MIVTTQIFRFNLTMRYFIEFNCINTLEILIVLIKNFFNEIIEFEWIAAVSILMNYMGYGLEK